MPLPIIGGEGIAPLGYTPLDHTAWYAIDDFDGGIPTTAVLGVTPTGNIGRLGWTLNTIGAAPIAVVQSAVSQHPGVILLSTTATSAQGGSISLGETTSIAPMFSGLDTISGWGFKFIFRMTNSGGETFYAGLLNQVNVRNPANYIAVRRDIAGSAGGTSAFAFVTVSGNTSTVVSIAPFTSGWHMAYIYCQTSGQVLCQFDTQSLASIGGTTITGVGLTPAFLLVTNSAVAKSVLIDFFAGRVPGLTRA